MKQVTGQYHWVFSQWDLPMFAALIVLRCHSDALPKLAEMILFTSATIPKRITQDLIRRNSWWYVKKVCNYYFTTVIPITFNKYNVKYIVLYWNPFIIFHTLDKLKEKVNSYHRNSSVNENQNSGEPLSTNGNLTTESGNFTASIQPTNPDESTISPGG